MLVIAASAGRDGIRWSGRRHDDDRSPTTFGDSAGGLFDAVFHALHDGEQVAVGFPAPLAVQAADAGAALEAAERESLVVQELVRLLGELGSFRPWTVVSTSLPRWRATTSVLIWETGSEDQVAAVETLFTLAEDRAERGAEDAAQPVVNLAAAAALRAGLSVDEGQLGEPVLLVSPVG